MQYYGFDNFILANTSEASRDRAMVDNPSQQLDSDGQKYLLAGTPLGASSDFRTSQSPVTLTPTNDATQVQAVLEHDVNVRDGAKGTAVLVGGTINRHQLDTSLQSIYTEDFMKQLKSVLPKLDFVDDNWD